MQNALNKYNFAACALLAVFLCISGIRPSDAAIFNFAGTCDDLFCPALGFGAAGSAVTGELELLDGAVSPGATFANTDVLAFSLAFELRDLIYAAPFFNSLGLSGPVGIFNPTAVAIETIDLTDSLGQMFAANLATEGSFFFTAVDVIGFPAQGTPVSFDVAPDAVPEPASMAMFLFALGSLILLARRRRDGRLQCASAVR